MSKKTPLKDIVVILPAFMGSVLQKDGRDIWNVSASVLIGAAFGQSFQKLKLQRDDPNGGDIGDGIKPTALFKDSYVIPVPGFGGFGKILDGYNKISQLITQNFDNVIQGNIYDDPENKAANFYHFPYDWRRDNRANANILKKLLDKRLKRWREFSGNKDAKVILLAHSMGGLISRYYLEVLEGWQDCKALFTLGTPYRGSVGTIEILADTDNTVANLIKKAMNLEEVLSSLNSIYQLLPRYPALKVGGKFYRIAESPVDLPGINLAKAKDGFNFHQEIDNKANINWKNCEYRNSCVTHPIVGVNQKTKQSARLGNGVIHVTTDLPDALKNRQNLAYGDEVVPQASATPIQSDKDIAAIASTDYTCESHAALQNQPDILLNLLQRIQMLQISLEEPLLLAPFLDEDVELVEVGTSRERRSEVKGIGLSLEDVYLAQEDVTLRATVFGDVPFNSLKAEITCVSQARPAITQNFVSKEDETWVMTMAALEPGSYQVKVQAYNDNASVMTPVHNLFGVVQLED